MRLFRGIAPVFFAAVALSGQTPDWTATGTFTTPHTQHPATLLPDGKVLVVGALSCNPGCFSLADAELYDPASGNWTGTAAPRISRFNHVAELLPNGRVLVAGGYVSPGELTGTAELYDPATAAWKTTGSLAVPRQFHSSALLPGGKVLVVGGLGMNGQGSFVTISSAEVYDSASGAWSSAGNLSVPRYLPSVTALSDGRVLVAGGWSSGDQSAVALQSAELYNPATNAWTPAATPGMARASHRAVLLPSGQVLVSGGSDGNALLDSAELYDPAADRWSFTGAMTMPRAGHSLTLLPSGRVLAAGGLAALINAETYDPVSGFWLGEADLTEGRASHSATLLPGGKVLVAGGANGPGGSVKGLTSSELFGLGALPSGGLASVSAASFRDNGSVAPESLAAGFGANLAASPAAASSATLPLTLGGVSVTVRDSAGVSRQAGMLSVSQTQINYQIPAGSAPGMANVTVSRDGSAAASGEVLITSIAPGVFSADGSGRGLAAALVQRVRADGTQSYEPVTAPIDLGPPGDQVFLVLFGTGIRLRSSLAAVSADMGGAAAAASFAGPSSQFPGVDQVNLPLSRSLAGRGAVNVVLSVDGLKANPVQIQIN